MNQTPASPFSWRPIIAGGLICGVLDINAAFISAYLVADRTPLWVLRAVASALLGRDLAFSAGSWAEALGLALHFFVATSWTIVFYLLSRKFPVLLRQAIPAGLLFGLGVYLFMNCVTIPFSSWFRGLYLGTPPNWTHAAFAWPQLCIHLFIVGLSISFAVRRWSRPLNVT